jgi:hypothetical protein
MHQHPPCPVCGGPVRQERGERLEAWLARKACGSTSCRNTLRSWTHRVRREGQLKAAVAAWTPGCSVSRLAQAYAVRVEELRLALREAGCQVKPAEVRVREEDEAPPRRVRRDEPPVDYLLLRLREVYGPAPTRRRQAA